MRSLLLVGLGALVLCSCDESGSPGGNYPAGDTQQDVVVAVDIRAETLADTTLSLDTSPALDAVSDTAPDTVPDIVSDTATDVATDADTPEDAGPLWDAAAGPPSVFVTVNRTPAEMNGSCPYQGEEHPETAFRLRLPLYRFTIDAKVEAADGGAPVDPESVDLSAELLPADGGEPVVFDWSCCFDYEEPWASLAVQQTDGLVPGVLTIRASGADIVGQRSDEDVLVVDVDELVHDLDPFPEPDTWFVVFSRDLYHLDIVDKEDGTYGLTPGPEPWTPDGVPDFDEAFAAIGLLSSNEETNAYVKHDIVEAIRQESYGVFLLAEGGGIGPDSVPVDFVFEGDPGEAFLEGLPGVAYSAIAIGGDGGTSDIEGGFVGRAAIDSNNQHANDNSVPGRGVYTGQIARIALSNPAGMMLLREIFPLTGIPIGEYEGDETFWDEDFDVATVTDSKLRNRYNLYQFAVELLSRALASTLCHEMGHSLGLVQPGIPPHGLFGGVELPWTDSNPGSWHIDTPGLNVMQTGAVTSYLEAGAYRPEFSALNLAYLRRRLIVDPE